MIYGQNKNAVPSKYSVYSVKGNDDKTSVCSAFDCKCHMSTPPPHTSPVSLKTVVLPVHAAGVVFHFHKFIHVYQREAKQRFLVAKSELEYAHLICFVAFGLCQVYSLT